MSDEPNGGPTPDATRDEPDGKRQRRSADGGGQTTGNGRNGNPNTGISSAADPYAGHQDKLQYIDVEFWENKLDGTLAEGEIMWFPAQMYPWDLFTSKGNEKKWKYLLENERYTTAAFPQDKIGKFSHWAIIQEPEITISKIVSQRRSTNVIGSAEYKIHLWQFSVPGNQPYVLLNKTAGGILGMGDHTTDQPYRKLEKSDNSTIYKKGLDGLEFAYQNVNIPNGYRAVTDKDVFNRTDINGFWYNAGPAYNHLEGPAQNEDKTTYQNWFMNEDQMRMNFTWGNIYNHAAMIFGGMDRSGDKIGNDKDSDLRQPFQPAIKDVGNFKSIYAGDIVKIHCNTGVKGKPMAAGIHPMESIGFLQAYDWGKIAPSKIESRAWYNTQVQPVWPRKNLPAVKRCLFNDLHMQLAAQQCNERSNLQFITIAPQKDRKNEQMKISVTFTIEMRWKMRCFLDCSIQSMGKFGDTHHMGTGSIENIFNETEIQLPWQVNMIRPKVPHDKDRKKFDHGNYMFLP